MAIETGPIQTLRSTIEQRLPFINKISLPSFLRKKPDNTGLGRVAADTESEGITNPFKTLEELKEKADIMAEIMDKRMVEQPPIGRMRWFVRAWFSGVFKDGGIAGLENLHWAIFKAQATGKRIILTPAHLADADHPAAIYLLGKRKNLLAKILGQKSRGLGIEDEVVWMAGVNMLRRPNVKRIMRAEHVIYNITPRDNRNSKTLSENHEEYGFDEEKVGTLEWTNRTFKTIVLTAMRRVVETCVKGKKPLGVYIEGGRAYGGFLKAPEEEFSSLFPKDDSAIVIPYRVYGAREFNPPGKEVKTGSLGLLRKEIFFPWLRHRVRMVVGESYSSAEIWEVVRKREEIEIGPNGEKIKINPMEWPAANIADIDLGYVLPQQRPLYISLMRRFGVCNSWKALDQIAA